MIFHFHLTVLRLLIFFLHLLVLLISSFLPSHFPISHNYITPKHTLELAKCFKSSHFTLKVTLQSANFCMLTLSASHMHTRTHMPIQSGSLQISHIEGFIHQILCHLCLSMFHSFRAASFGLTGSQNRFISVSL